MLRRPPLLTAILFSPRGGSAHLTRAFTAALRERGWPLTLLAGSREDQEGLGDARAFYGPDVRAVDFTPALCSGRPMAFSGPPGTAPMHPSFEDRPGAPDRAFPTLDGEEYELQVQAWSRELRRASASRAAVLLLHHLTPLNEAAARVAPEVPVVGQLHGTELLMLEAISAGAPSGWRYAAAWAARLGLWAARCERLLVAPGSVERATRLLGVAEERVAELGGGVDVARFAPATIDRERFWGEVLGEASADAGGGSVAESCVLLYVGRFTAVKRLDRLVRAFRDARAAAGRPAVLVLVGGHPGELEGEHPVALARRLGVEGVLHAGWQPQEALPQFYSAADAVVLASDREGFGQVLVEGMACGLPAVAVRSSGPAAIIEDGVSGWLAEPSDAALAEALRQAIADPVERRRRGAAAREAVVERFSWDAAAERLDEVLLEAAGGIALGGGLSAVGVEERPLRTDGAPLA